MTTHHTTSDPAKSNREALVEELQSMPLLGEVISWSMLENRGHKNTYVDVITALQQNGLDAEVAKEFTAAKAFTRALLQLKEERVIDVIRKDAEEILFQFSKRNITDDTEEGGTEYEYKKEHKLLLNKSTGKISCKNAKLKELAQKELDRCLQERTTGDISFILDHLYRVNSDLMSIGQGVYFTPQAYAGFNNKIQGFMTDLGRKIVRLPVPQGTAVGDRSVQEVVSTHLKSMIDDMKSAVNSFTPTTRQNTLDNMIERINSTRIKAESYVTLLQDYQDEILQAVGEVNTLLETKVGELEEERKNNPDLSSNISHMAEQIMTVVDSNPKTPKQLKQALKWDLSDTINGALVKLMEAGKIEKKNGGYVKI